MFGDLRQADRNETTGVPTTEQARTRETPAAPTSTQLGVSLLDSSVGDPTQLDLGPPLVTAAQATMASGNSQGKTVSDDQVGKGQNDLELLLVGEHLITTSKAVANKGKVPLVDPIEATITTIDLQGESLLYDEGIGREISELPPLHQHLKVTSAAGAHEGELSLETTITSEDSQGNTTSDGDAKPETAETVSVVELLEAGNIRDEPPLVTLMKNMTNPQDSLSQISSDDQGTDGHGSELLPVDKHSPGTSEAVNNEDQLTLAPPMETTTTPEESQDITTSDNQDKDQEIAEASSIVEPVTVTLESVNIRDKVLLVTPKETITTQHHILSSDQDRGQELLELLTVSGHPNVTSEAVNIRDELSLVIPMETIVTLEDTQGKSPMDDQGSDREMPELSPVYPDVLSNAVNTRDELSWITPMETTVADDYPDNTSSYEGTDSEDSKPTLVLGHYNVPTETPDNQDTWSVTTDECISEPDESDEDTKSDHIYKMLAKLKTEEIDLDQEDCKLLARQPKSCTSGDLWNDVSVRLSEIEQENNGPAQADLEFVYQKCPDIICSDEGRVAVDLIHHKTNPAEVAEEVPDMADGFDETASDDIFSSGTETGNECGDAFKCARCDFETSHQSSLANHENRCHPDIATSPFQYNANHKLYCYSCHFRTGSSRFMTRHRITCHKGTNDCYFCAKCTFSTANRLAFKSHQSISHGIQQKTSKCSKCLYTSSSNLALEDHKRRCHFDNVSSPFKYDENCKFYCHLCNYRTVSIQILKQHLKKYHNDLNTYYYCMICRFSTRDKDELERHSSSDIHGAVNRQDDSSKFQCTNCYFESPFEESVEDHTARCHPKDSSFPFQYENTYKFHCHLCQYRSFLIHGMVQHLLRCHRDSTTYYYCQTCPFSTSDKSELESHNHVQPIKVDADASQFQCTNCYYQHTSKPNMAYHISRCHPDDSRSPFKYSENFRFHCHLCQFRTAMLRPMTEHVFSCHRDSTTYYYCVSCPFSTCDEAELESHNLRLHQSTTAKPITCFTSMIQCDQCYYQTEFQALINSHRDRCHPNHSPTPFQYNKHYKFHCHLCQYRTQAINLMVNHLEKCHRDLTTYFYCSICPFNTSDESELERHNSESHKFTATRPITYEADTSTYQCDRCFYQTAHRVGVVDHIDRCHPDDSLAPFKYNKTYKLHCHLCQYRAKFPKIMEQHLTKCHKGSTGCTDDDGELEHCNLESNQGSSNQIACVVDTSTYECGKCFYRSTNRASLADHKNRCHPDDSSSPFQYNNTFKIHCHLCQYRSQEIVQIVQHLSRCHRNLTTYFYCTTCPFSTSDESELERHNSELHQGAMSTPETCDNDTCTYQCDKCYYQSGNQSNFEKHTDQCHPGDNLSSPFQYDETYNLHCHLCQYRAQVINLMVKHLERCHRDLTTYYYCTICTFNTGDENELERHNSELHQDALSGSKTCDTVDTSTYQCNKCYFQSRNKQGVNKHTDRCHLDDSSSPFQYNETYKLHCHLCQYRTQMINLMVKHLERCHRDLTTYYYCTICTFNTGDENELERHNSELHQDALSGSKTCDTDETYTYQCDKCNFQCRSRNEHNVKRHTDRCHLDHSSSPFQYNETYKLHCHLCQYRTFMPKLMVRHLKMCHLVSKIYYYCRNCPFSTSDKSELERHNSELHQGAMPGPETCNTNTFTYQCDKCYFQSKNKPHFEKHRDRCHFDDLSSPVEYNESYKFHCHLCQYRAQGIKMIAKHLEKCHRDLTTYFYCTICAFNTSDESELERHNSESHQSTTSMPITYNTNTSTYQCDQCCYQSKNKPNFEKHRSRCHFDDLTSPVQYDESYRFHCHLCQYRAQGINMMAKHLEQCHRDSTTYFYCTICAFNTSDECDLERHNSESHQSTTSRPITYNTNTSTYQCDKCCYQSKNKLSLEKHRDRCHFDNLSSPFQYNESYRFHCHLCQYRAQGINLMVKHLEQCHRDSTTYFYCTICAFNTSVESELERHNSESHQITKSRPLTYNANTYVYQCDRCYYQSRNKPNAESHTDRSHTDESPSPFQYNETYKFHCHLCQYRTSMPKLMARHLKTCHRVTTIYYYCTRCPFSTSDESELERHNSELHQGAMSGPETCDTKYRCDKCYYQSGSKPNVDKHIDRSHPEDSSSPFRYNKTYRLHCHLCQYRASKPKLMVRHLKMCHLLSTIFYYCSSCPFSTSDESELKLHVLEKHRTIATSGQSKSGSKDQCNKCHFKSRFNLYWHKSRCHFDDSASPYQYSEAYKLHCPLCQYRALVVQRMVRHLKLCHRDSTTYYYCTICPFSVSDKSEFESHNSELHQGMSEPIACDSKAKFRCANCDFVSNHRNNLEVHKSRCHFDDSSSFFKYDKDCRYHCHLCQYRASGELRMAKHVRKCHKESPPRYYCTTCAFSTSDQSELERHNSEPHPNLFEQAAAPKFQCTKCDFNCTDNWTLDTHKSLCHFDDSPNPFKYQKDCRYHCHLCQYRATGEGRMAIHVGKCHKDSPPRYYCTTCAFSTSDQSELERHNSELHPSLFERAADDSNDASKLRCTKCDFEAIYKGKLEAHKNRCHLEDTSSPFKYSQACRVRCHLCQYRSVGRQLMVLHYSKCHKDSPPRYYCTICAFSTSDPSELERHNSEPHQNLLEQAAGPKFRCTKCDFNCTKNWTLDVHKRLCHFDDSPNPFKYQKDCRYHCHLCQYRASGEGRMAIHVGKCHKDSPPRYYCTTCAFSTIDKSELGRHNSELHSNVLEQAAGSKFLCTKCDFNCTKCLSLDTHKRLCHFDDSPNPFKYQKDCRYHCHLCQYRTTGEVRMAIHVGKCHKDSPPRYYCTPCAFSTSDQSELERHNSELHPSLFERAADDSNDASKLRCTKCDFEALYKSKLEAHKNRCHFEDASSPFKYSKFCRVRCHLCQYRSTRRQLMALHFSKCHKDSPPRYHYTICASSTSDPSELERHNSGPHPSLFEQAAAPKLRCTKCDFEAAYNCMLEAHKNRCHFEDASSPFKYSQACRVRCHLCQYRSPSRQLMALHFRKCHKDSSVDHYCTSCPFTASDPNHLKLHSLQAHRSLRTNRARKKRDPLPIKCRKCFYGTNQNYELAIHVRRCHPSASSSPVHFDRTFRFYCHVCQFRSRGSATMTMHLKTCHRVAKPCYYYCQMCPFSTSDDDRLKRHKSEVHGDPDQRVTDGQLKLSDNDPDSRTFCSECHYATGDSNNLYKHMRRCHPDSSQSAFRYTEGHRFHCHLCQYRSLKLHAMEDHMTICHDSAPYWFCNDCSFSTSDESDLKNHRSSTHKTTEIGSTDQCEDPDTESRSKCHPFGTSDDDKQQESREPVQLKLSKDTKLRCTKCRYEAADRGSLHKHKTRCHRDLGHSPFPYTEAHRFHCNLCQYRSVQTHAMVFHMNICHYDSRPNWYCKDSILSTGDKNDLASHRASTHKGSSDIPKAVTINNIIEHTIHKMVSSDATTFTYQCAKCYYGTDDQLMLDTHMDRSHPEESHAPFQYDSSYEYHCHLCQYRVQMMDSLVQHLRECHRLSTTYFHCTTCPFRTIDKIELERHESDRHKDSQVATVVTSSDAETQIQCVACYYTSSSKVILRAHLKRCHLENAFRYGKQAHNLHCPFCQFRGIATREMEEHLTVCHRDSKVYHFCTTCSFSTSDEDEFKRHTSEPHQKLSHSASRSDECDPSEFSLDTVVDLTENQSITGFLENSSNLPVEESTATSSTSDIISPQAISSPVTQAGLADVFLENTSDLPAPVESTESTTSASAPLETDNVTTSNEFRCPKCHYVTQCTESFEDHTSRCHPDDSPSPFQYNVDYKLHCPLCQFRSFFNDGLTEHLEVCHRDSTSYSYCTSCPFKSSDYIALVSHNLESHQGLNIVGGNLVVDKRKSTDVVSNSQAAVKRGSSENIAHPVTKLARQSEMVPCTKCHFKAGQLNLLKRHFDRCHQTGPSAFVYKDSYKFHCHSCGFRAISMKEISKHLEVCHRDFNLYYFCTLCGGTTAGTFEDHRGKCTFKRASKKQSKTVSETNSDTSNTDTEIDSTKGALCCASCNFRSDSKLDLAAHIKKSHRKRKTRKRKSLTCSMCAFSTSDKSLLERHQSQHDPDKNKVLSCYFPDCGYQTVQQLWLLKHLKFRHFQNSTAELKCRLCSYKITEIDLLVTHLKVVHHGIAHQDIVNCVTGQFCIQPVETPKPKSSPLIRYYMNKGSTQSKFGWGCGRKNPAGTSSEAIDLIVLSDSEPEIDEESGVSSSALHQSNELSKRLKVYTPALKYPCDKCEFQSNYKANLNNHTSQCHPACSPSPFQYDDSYVFSCCYCQYRTSKEDLVLNHLRVCHEGLRIVDLFQANDI